ncbi:hypothetical protein [Roseibium aggregatum]
MSTASEGFAPVLEVWDLLVTMPGKEPFYRHPLRAKYSALNIYIGSVIRA